MTALQKLLDTNEAAQIVGLGKSTLDKLRISGGGPRFVKVGGRRVLYDPADLREWLDGLKRRSTSDRGAAA
ncbi:helix-turn-helix transcriptional regulator [Ancylobacter terrae]|uniref:helix-turn-helix transcriptional regulator n=1 Tax=Ancylobacter sp. sgz301288 TaxID=3342077 RepID=UPI00385DA37E